MNLIDKWTAMQAVQGIDSVATLRDGDPVIRMSAVEHVLENLPETEPEHKTGRWIAITSWNNTYKCSVCGRLLTNITDGKNKVAKNYPYCHCGADMRGEQNG